MIVNPGTFLETIGRDLLYALRTMRKNRTFTASALLTLALGIGGNAAMFTVVRAVLLKPLAYREPDRLVEVSGGATSVRFDEMKAAARSYTGLGDYFLGGGVESITLSGSSAEPEVLKSARVSANFLSILEVHPLLGRPFRHEEDTAVGPRVAMISSELWHRHFGGDATILGKTATLGATPYTIIGVLPPGFQFPFPDVDVWITRPSENVSSNSPVLSVFGRLKPGVTTQQAASELAVLNQQYRTAHPGMLDGKPTVVGRVTTLRDSLVANVRFLLWMLFGAVGFVLLIACANVASLLLARAASRSREFAVRSAVGASRSRLIGQLLAESIVLAVAGGALGVLLARWSLVGITHMTVLDLPRAGEIQMDGMVLGFALLLSTATGMLFGLIPSLGASRPDLAAVLRASGGVANVTRRRFAPGLSVRGALVIGQVALATVLLIGAALLMGSLVRLSHVYPGFNPSRLLTFRISLPPLRYNTNEKQARFFDGLVRRVQSVLGVRNAAAAMTLPMTGFARTPVQLADQPPHPLNERPLAVIEDVTPAYFRTLEIPLKRGREFSERDVAGAPPTTMVNESLARVLWPAYPKGLNPVGRHILIGAKADPVEVVGVVADMHQSLAWDAWPGIFRPFNQSPLPFAGVAVRTAGDPLSLVHAINGQVLAIDRDQPASAFETMDDLMEAEGGQRRLVLRLLGGFGGAALLLAVIGIYGVMAYSVAQRTPEMGIRRALGAQHADILRLVVGGGLALTLAGVALGIGAALVLTRVLTSLLFHTSATDPATFAGITFLFIVVASAASYLPARRAAQVDPTKALRME